MNNTYNIIINQVKQIRAWKNIKDNIDKLYIRPTKLGNYSIWFDGNFTGMFLNKSSINLDELKNTCIKYDKTIFVV